MKKFSYKLILILFIVCQNLAVSGKTIYLSSSGDNTKDGLTAATAVAHFSVAQTKAVAGDVIQVAGMIDFSADPANTASPKVGVVLAKTLTIQGTSPASDGFDGNNLTRFIQANGSTFTLTLKNLKLFHGAFSGASGGGGALYIGGSTVVGENLIFDSNATSVGTGNTGSAIQVGTTSGISFKNCVFSNNTSIKAGTVYVNDAIANASLKFEACAFISNTAQATTGGTALFLRSTQANLNVSFINCTIAKNSVNASVDGGVIYLYSGLSSATVNIINCTITENTTAGSAGHGAGIRIYTTATGQFLGKLNIQNSIIEGNYSKQTGAQYSDLSISSVTPTSSTLMINNSFVGRNANVSVPVECYPGNNQFNYLSSTSILFDLKARLAAFDDSRNIYPLLASSQAINYGNSQYLQTLNVATDQVGNTRPFTNNVCYAGAAEFTGLPPIYQGNGDVYKHFIMYGQSLSTGHQSYPVISTENIPGNYMLGDQIWVNYGNTNFTSFNPLVGTISNAFKSQSNIMNRTAGTIAECPLFGTVNHLQSKTLGDKILATSCGTSGMSIEQLSKESQTQTLYSDFTKAIRYAAYTAMINGNSVVCPAIFWMQGEWNYQGYGEGLTTGSIPTSDKAAYKSLMLTLKNNMQTDVMAEYNQTSKPLFICYQTGVQYIKGKEQAIGMAQLEASNENDDVVCAGNVSQMTDRGGHLDANGYRWYGEMLGKVYYRTKVLNQKFKPLQPVELSRTGNSNQLKVKFFVPFKPLVMDTLILAKVKDYGFEVYADNVKQTVNSVSILDDCVYLTCSAPLTGVVEVVYAGQNTAGNGNLRDSDPYQAFFKYIDLDKKNPDDTYVYPRDASETTLRPTYEPKDANGNVIYDQPYPLYNFGVSFYYKLNAGQQLLQISGFEDTLTMLSPVRKNDSNLKIYRSGGWLYVDSPEKDFLGIDLFNISGKLIRTFCGNVRKFPVSGLENGVFLARIKTKNRVDLIKLVVD